MYRLYVAQPAAGATVRAIVAVVRADAPIGLRRAAHPRAVADQFVVVTRQVEGRIALVRVDHVDLTVARPNVVAVLAVELDTHCTAKVVVDRPEQLALRGASRTAG